MDMNTNRITVIGSIVAIILLISIPTVYKVIKNHQSHLIKVVEDKIISAAKECYYEEKCIEDKITLKDLYSLNYLEKMSNPISKEYYNEKSYVEKKENKFIFIPVE